MKMYKNANMCPLTFSVVICTHNRFRYLPDAVTSLRTQTYPAEAYEIIVVDNASSDDTANAIRQLQAKSGQPVRYIYEAQAGLAFARNRGAREANGEVIAYIDDDAIAHSDWLTALAESYKFGEANVVGVAGAVHLTWESGRPDWLPVELESYLSATPHLSDRSQFLEPGRYPVGTNFSVRRKQLIELDGFFPILVRQGYSLLYNDEIELCHRIWSSGGQILYNPKALVHHRASTARTTRGYLLRRGYRQGVSDAILRQLVKPRSRAGLLRATAANTIFLTQDIFKVAYSQLTGENNQAFSQLVYSLGRLGRLQQTFQLALSGSLASER